MLGGWCDFYEQRQGLEFISPPLPAPRLHIFNIQTILLSEFPDFTQRFDRVEADGLGELHELDHIYATLAALQPRHPDVGDAETACEFHLPEAHPDAMPFYLRHQLPVLGRKDG